MGRKRRREERREAINEGLEEIRDTREEIAEASDVTEPNGDDIANGQAEFVAAFMAGAPIEGDPNPTLFAGIRIFTAMLREARAGYVLDRLAQLEDALEIEFDPLEREGIVQIALSQVDVEGVPSVEDAVRLAIGARAQTSLETDA